jgi:7-cyano-7-deazaguanine reductase
MSLADAPLGRDVPYPDQYDPTLLFPIPRAENRAHLGIGAVLPFHGVDIWNAYELSWLDTRGKPCVALARFVVPAGSPNIVESKSLKLYLNSFSQTRVLDTDELQRRIAADLSAAAGLRVAVEVIPPGRFDTLRMAELQGHSLDSLDIEIDAYEPAPELLRCVPGAPVIEETLTSQLLKSNCPVTGQPDWGSVQIRYRGPRIDRAALLRYIVSFRRHTEFHEHCVERMHVDIMRACAPESLAVYARYTRRGGLDINPWRGTPGLDAPPDVRTARQ